MVFFSVIYLHFAKQSIKKDEPKTYFLIVNVFYFDQKFVPMYSNIRLLERDEWIFLDKDPKANRQNIIELPSQCNKRFGRLSRHSLETALHRWS